MMTCKCCLKSSSALGQSKLFSLCAVQEVTFHSAMPTIIPKFDKCDNPNTFVGLVGKVRKKTISRRGKEGRVEKKSARSAPAGPGARTRDLPRARRGSPAARHGGCLDKQAFPCL